MRTAIPIYKLLTTVILLFSIFSCIPAKAEKTQNGNILIVTSYNPETQKMAENLSSFMNEYKRLGGKYIPVIENLNCNNLPDIPLWKARMTAIFEKYNGQNRPALIILLGQEAWAAFLSQNSDTAKRTPAMCGLVSSNGILLPDDGVDIKDWEPESKSIFTDFEKHNLVGGVVYEYDVDKNIELMRKLYPNMHCLAFISDNTYGGLSLQALMKKRMKKYPELQTIWLDGRHESFMQVSKKLTNMPENTCVLIGSWRVDSSEIYLIGNTTHVLREANPNLPAFTLTSVGLGHWTIGGYTPVYGNVGESLAQSAYQYLDMDNKDKVRIETLPCHYIFDKEQLDNFGIKLSQLPEDSELINVPKTFYEEYKPWIIGIIVTFFIMIIFIMFAINYIVHIRSLKRNLEVTSERLCIAKNEAEEANRLKTAFLANMSHEIRTPLNAIVGFSEIVTTDDEMSKEEKRKYCDIIQQNSQLLLKLINDILDISRMESGKIRMSWGEYDLVDLCRTALITVESTKRTKAEFRLEAPVESLPIRTDSQRLKQVLINLLTNAAKFTPSGSITLSFTVDEEKNLTTVSVTDTGRGIPEDKRERIFDRFEKLDEFVQGTGLGLSICRLIIDLLGGKIWVDKNYNEGARFMFTHPIKQGLKKD